MSKVAQVENHRVSLVSKEEALRVARFHEDEARSPTLKMYWRQVRERLEVKS